MYLLLIITLVGLLTWIFTNRINRRNRYIIPSQDDAIVITGCDSGIGLEIAKHFATKFSFKIICCFLHHGSSDGFMQLSELASQTEEQKLILQQLNVTLNEDVESLVERIKSLQTKGSIRFVKAIINNAGVMIYGEFDWQTRDQIRNQVDVNLLGVLRITQALLPNIIESRGRIINVSSVCDSVMFPGVAVYAATKIALSKFSDLLAFEMRKFQVKIIKIRLGDFAKVTNIMANHVNNRKLMWDSMSSEKRSLYQGYFDVFNKLAIDNAGASGPNSFDQSTLLEDFERAIFAEHVPNTITIAPMHFKIIYSIFELMPVGLNHILIETALRLGVGLRLQTQQ